MPFFTVGVFADYEILLIYSGSLYKEERDLPGDSGIKCKQYLKQRTIITWWYYGLEYHL